MTQNNVLDAMRAPRTESSDAMKAYRGQPQENVAGRKSAGSERKVTDPQVELHAAFGLGSAQRRGHAP